MADGDTKGFLERALGQSEGEIVDEAGEVVGAHTGAYAYTVGQRKGLRLPRPAADGAPRFVTEVDTVRNLVVVGPETLLSVRQLVGEDVVWLAHDVPAVDPTQCLAQVRAHGEPVAGSVRLGPDDAGRDRMLVELDQPMRGVAAGQSLVIYQGTRVIAQATIAKREL